MLKNMKIILLLLALITPLSFQVEAASEDECAIWICAPGGFPSGCEAAHAAMVNRIEHLHPPLPPFLDCAEKEPGQSNMSYDYNYAAYVPAGSRCIRWVSDGGGEESSGSSYCASYQSWDSHWVKGQRCRKHCSEGDCYTSPDGCTSTARYVDVFVDGQLAGETYYWGNRRVSRFF